MLHIRTPLVLHHGLSTSERRIWLKLENLQPSGSFKLRGIGLLCEEAARAGKTEFICPSGGNAGVAVAFAAKKLGIKCSIIVPKSTPAVTREIIASLGASVTVHGAVWDEANALAQQLAKGEHVELVPAFDHPTLWRGHSTMIDEIIEEKPEFDALVTAIGGGGLLAGLMVGLDRHKRHDVDVIGCETTGSASFAAAVAAGRPVNFPLDTVCGCLAAGEVAAWPVEQIGRFRYRPAILSDAEALSGAVRFADDMRQLVEPACGVSLAVAYLNHPLIANAKDVVVIVCGGASTSASLLEGWRHDVAQAA
ncbi:pyridoxal-phosphate dependent enzyme [Ferrovibrio terrae]|uniref:L-serine ammonia-lyase n=1 Tax=Ferrovibrio terrae TaxID=2594003 RepID=A0A516H007_9PROT|nr:pyridoxal-phosphate dependent enzyme [Ferrovibrio terrae]QDO97108.1 pyridoxal-phosphate dependent enzyme [Ferrovibrio terrae]